MGRDGLLMRRIGLTMRLGGLIVSGRMIALLVLFGRCMMGFRGSLMGLSSFGMKGVRHSKLHC